MVKGASSSRCRELCGSRTSTGMTSMAAFWRSGMRALRFMVGVQPSAVAGRPCIMTVLYLPKPPFQKFRQTVCFTFSTLISSCHLIRISRSFEKRSYTDSQVRCLAVARFAMERSGVLHLSSCFWRFLFGRHR